MHDGKSTPSHWRTGEILCKPSMDIYGGWQSEVCSKNCYGEAVGPALDRHDRDQMALREGTEWKATPACVHTYDYRKLSRNGVPDYGASSRGHYIIAWLRSSGGEPAWSGLSATPPTIGSHWAAHPPPSLDFVRAFINKWKGGRTLKLMGTFWLESVFWFAGWREQVTGRGQAISLTQHKDILRTCFIKGGGERGTKLPCLKVTVWVAGVQLPFIGNKLVMVVMSTHVFVPPVKSSYEFEGIVR